MEKISVCMATYNGAQYVKEQIESILPQLRETDELIISDDASNDRTIEIVSKIRDPRINLFGHKHNHGYTANYEFALYQCKGDIIMLCDQDDIWHKDKVERTLEALKYKDFAMSNAIIVDQNLNHICESRNDLYHVKNGFVRNLIKTRYLGCCIAFRRNLLEYVLPFPKNRELCLHDAWISLCAEYHFSTTIIDAPLIYYRRHLSNASAGGESHSSLAKMIKIRGYLLYHLLLRRYRKKEKAKDENIVKESI